MRRFAHALAAIVVASASAAQAPGTFSGAWEVMAPLPDMRTEVSVTTDGERLYLLGGFAPSDRARAAAPLAVYTYDAALDTWGHITDLPQGVNHAGLVFLNGELWVVGGFVEATFRATGRVMVYDFAGNAWRDAPPLLTPRGALAAVVAEGRIHAIGGEDAAGQDTTAHEVFDPATGLWSTLAPLPTARNHLAAAVVDGAIVTIAGRNPAGFLLTTNEIYDPATDSWRAGAPVPTGRSGVAAVEAGGFVYLFGGEGPPGTFDEAERYDIATDTWQVGPPMPTPRHGLGAAALGGFIYVVSGGPQPGFTFSDVNERLRVE